MRPHALSPLAICPLILVAGLAGCKSETEDQFPVAVALGTPPTGLFEVHIGVDIDMVRMEGPQLSNKGNQLWDDWVKDHVRLLDANRKEREPEVSVSIYGRRSDGSSAHVVRAGR